MRMFQNNKEMKESLSLSPLCFLQCLYFTLRHLESVQITIGLIKRIDLQFQWNQTQEEREREESM